MFLSVESRPYWFDRLDNTFFNPAVRTNCKNSRLRRPETTPDSRARSRQSPATSKPCPLAQIRRKPARTKHTQPPARTLPPPLDTLRATCRRTRTVRLGPQSD